MQIPRLACRRSAVFVVLLTSAMMLAAFDAIAGPTVAAPDSKKGDPKKGDPKKKQTAAKTSGKTRAQDGSLREEAGNARQDGFKRKGQCIEHSRQADSSGSGELPARTASGALRSGVLGRGSRSGLRLDQ